jgi:uncharacterized protein (TIGR02284 family)
MAASTHDFISTLNNLVETCKDGEEGFRHASEGAQRSDLKTIFNEYSRQRAQFASELQMEVSRLGGDPAKGGSVSGAMHRGWIDIKSAVTGKDDHAILEEAERGEDVAVKAYRDALNVDLPSDVRTIVARQSQQVEEAHRRIRALRDTREYSDAPATATPGVVL